MFLMMANFWNYMYNTLFFFYKILNPPSISRTTMLPAAFRLASLRSVSDAAAAADSIKARVSVLFALVMIAEGSTCMNEESKISTSPYGSN